MLFREARFWMLEVRRERELLFELLGSPVDLWNFGSQILLVGIPRVCTPQ